MEGAKNIAQAREQSRGAGDGSRDWLETERIITEMLQIASRRLSLHETLRQCLDVLLKTKWLRIENKGGIFLVGDDQETLTLFTDHNLGSDITSRCAKVPFGHCMCGRAAVSKTVQHAECVDARHDIRFEGMKPHGHYNVPILKEGKVLGVVVLYLPHGFKKTTSEVIFLSSVANILSLVIQIKGQETRLEDLVEKRTRQLEKEVERGKRKAAALYKSESRLKQLLDLAPEAIVSTDEEGKICLFNKSAENLFGFTKQELIDEPLDRLLPARFRDAHRAHIQTFAGSQTAIKMMSQRGEIVGLKKDGTEFPARASISKLAIDGGSLFTVLVKDVSEQKSAQEAMQHAKQVAESANRAKSEFLANTSHEFKTPLNAIIGFAEIVATADSNTMDCSGFSEFGVQILQSGENLLGLINDVLDVSRIETGEASLHEVDIAVANIVHNTVRMIHRRYEQATTEIVVEVGNDLPPLCADKRMVKQILANLLSNAIKFSPEGGTVRTGAWLDRGGHVFQVSDEGIGMESAAIEKVLQPFHQVDSALSRGFGGLGLGLPLVKLYADCHGASLEIDSAPAKGTTVTVRFPADRTM